jgi:hypothetical protein
MIEIIAGVWLISFLLSIPITVWNVHTVMRSKRSSEYSVLNSNLAKIGLFWSLSNEQIVSLSEGDPDKDANKLLRTYLMIGGLGLLSVFGLIFLSIVSLSIHVLVKSRLAAKVLNSDLAKNPDLQPGDIEMLVKDLD